MASDTPAIEWRKVEGGAAKRLPTAFWRDPRAELERAATRLKSSAYHRETWCLPTEGGAVVVKQFSFATLRERMKWAVSATAAQKEWKILEMLWQRGVPVPAPVAFGVQRHARGRTVWLVVAQVAGAVTFDRVMPRAHARAARMAARSLARAVAAMHVAGVCHRDLHAGNILFDPVCGAWFITDFQRARAGVPSRSDMVHDLVQLHHCMGKKVALGVRTAFLQEYLREFARLTDTAEQLTGREWRALLAEIRAKSRAYLVHQGASRCGRATRATRDAVPLDAWAAPDALPAGIGRGWVRRGLSRQLVHDLLDLLGKDTWHLDPSVLLIKNTRTSIAGVWTHPQGRLFVRQWRADTGVGGRMRAALRGTRLERAWRAAWRARVLHVATPAPAMAVWTRHGEVLVEAALTDELSLDAAMRDDARKRDPRTRCRMLAAVAAAVGHMHDCGVQHGDLTAAHVYLGRSRAGFTSTEDARFHHALAVGARATDLARLHAATYSLITDAERRQFLRLYLKAQSQPVPVRHLLLALLERARNVGAGNK